MNHTVLRKWMAVLLAAVLCLGLLPAGAMAADEDFQVSKSKTADVDVLDRDDPVTEITLAMPSGEYQNKIDIVFVMDSSSSTDLGTVFIDSATGLFDSIVKNNPNVNLKIGVILFTGSANDAIEYVSNGDYKELTVYNDDTKGLFSDSFKISDDLTKDEFRNQFGRGSGPHVGLDLANQWLEEDSEVESDHKYVILFTDGKGYIWANDNHEPTTIYTQYYTNNQYTLASGGKAALSQTSGYNKPDYSVDVLDSSGKSNVFTFPKHSDGKYYYKDLYNSTSEELTGVTKWDQPCPYAFGETWASGFPEGLVTKHDVTNGADLFGTKGTYGYHKDYQYWYEFTPTGDWEDLVYMEANPFAVINNGDETYTFDTDTINPNYYQYHVDCLQKGLYKTGHLWKDMGENYKCAVVTYDSSTGGGLEMVDPFKEWLRENSLYSAQRSNTEAIQEMFTGIDNSIRYLIGSGVVTDEITDEFDLVMEAYGEDGSKVPFKLEIGETDAEGNVTYSEVPAEPVTPTEDGADVTEWTFGTKNDETGKFPYTVKWDSENNTFTWTINVPVENIKPLHLSYKLQWNGDGVPGDMTDTNASTELVYWRSTTVTPDPDKPDGTEDFTSPKVLYPLQVTYDANGGTGTVSDNNGYKKNDNVTLAANGFTRSGYTFQSWNTAADGSGDKYAPNDAYTLTADTTFYAIWSQNPSGGGGGPTPPEIIPDEDVPLAPIPSVLNGDDHFAYVEGYPDGTVKPEGNVTRAETSTMLYRLLKPTWRDIYFTDQNSFSDVEKALWFNKAVSSMANGEYVNGYPDGTFQGNKHITRAEFVTIMVRFLEEDTTYDNPFSDIGSHWAKEYILKAVGAGWIDGYPDGTFRPNNEITRAEAMKIINSVLHRGVNETSELGQPQHLFPDNSDPGKWYYYEVIEATNDHEYEGERPDENWTRNAIDYFYDIVKYERPEA